MNNRLIDITKNNWLFDDQVYYFSEEIWKKSDKKREFIIISPLIYSSINQITKLLNKELNNDIKYMLVIINLNNSHWILGLINFEKNFISILDSYFEKNNHNNHKETFKKLLTIQIIAQKILKVQYKPPKFYLPNNNPQQVNDCDCGVFVCKYIENIMENNYNLFEINHGEYRPYIIEILENKTQNEIIHRERVALDQQLKIFISNEEYNSLIRITRIIPNTIEYTELIKLFNS